MAQEQNYQVNYEINVNATKGTDQVNKFAESVQSLLLAKNKIDPALSNIKSMMEQIDKAFRTKGGKKRDYSFQMSIKTEKTEERLGRVKKLLGEIGELSKGVNLVINAGQRLDSKGVKANAAKILTAKQVEDQKAAANKLASESVKGIRTAQKEITKSIGRINSALAHLERGREVNIKTDVAKQRLQELLRLLRQVNAGTTRNPQMGSSVIGKTGLIPGVPLNAVPAPYSPTIARPFILSEKEQEKLNKRLYTNKKLHQQKLGFSEENAAAKLKAQMEANATKTAERERLRALKQQEANQKKLLADQQKAQQKQLLEQQRNAMESLRNTQRIARVNESVYGGRRRAAINRLQYSRPPQIRNMMPFAYMLNGYMAYNLMRKGLTGAVEYANTMESARSILKAADGDLSTFENRFEVMARNVRQVGVETKFTAVEVAGAVKYLAMAGQGIETINESIRPITNLALIGDNDVSQIADLATNIMAGYDISSKSMVSVADIIASTISRSNVNIIETAESFKMAAGYLRMSGVDFSESAAAIGVLGNMGIKGTMAGTALRAMSTRFAKPPKEAQKVLDRLGVKFTYYEDIYGKQVEKLRPLADIFEDLNKSGATLGDMQAIFGKIGGNAGMMFLQNYEQLRKLATQNRASHGVSGELAKVKQDTTKGLWFQVTSQLSETFMQGYEILEPQIKGVLKNFLEKFKAPQFAHGLASVGKVLLDLFTTLTNIATWFARNFNWLEPILFTGFVATRLFKLAGAVTNLGVALGFLGKQSMASSTLQAISSLTGLGGLRGMGGMSFANKRALVSTMQAAGITGKGAMTQALASAGISTGASTLVARGAASGLFASQVATGNGLIGAGASIAALGTGAMAATAGIAGLVGVLGWVAYKTWKVKEAKDAMLEEIEANRKYRYPSIEALYDSLNDTYKKAIDTKKAVDDVTAGKTLQDATGHKVGAFTWNWWKAAISNIGRAESSKYSAFGGPKYDDFYDFNDAYQDDLRASVVTLAKKDSQNRINSAFAEFGAMRDPLEVGGFIQAVSQKYGQAPESLDTSLWTMKNGKAWYKDGLKNISETQATKMWDYANYHNTITVPEIIRAATVYRDAIATPTGARELMKKGGFDFDFLTQNGFYLNSEGNWVQKAASKDTTDKEREEMVASRIKVNDVLVKFTASLRNTFGGSAEAAETIMKIAGFTPGLYSNEPNKNDPRPFDANGITISKDADDNMAGGNYSGTGKLSSAAPKQVVVNITNLLSVETIDLMKSPEANNEEIKNLKEQMAQALIDVVHDFDASWNS